MRLFNSPKRNRCLQVSRMALVVSLMLHHFNCWPKPKERNVLWDARLFIARYRTIQIDALSIFYREAGPKDAPGRRQANGEYPRDGSLSQRR